MVSDFGLIVVDFVVACSCRCLCAGTLWVLFCWFVFIRQCFDLLGFGLAGLLRLVCFVLVCWGCLDAWVASFDLTINRLHIDAVGFVIYCCVVVAIWWLFMVVFGVWLIFCFVVGYCDVC